VVVRSPQMQAAGLAFPDLCVVISCPPEAQCTPGEDNHASGPTEVVGDRAEKQGYMLGSDRAAPHPRLHDQVSPGLCAGLRDRARESKDGKKGERMPYGKQKVWRESPRGNA
jgi:hypothetical protein